MRERVPARFRAGARGRCRRGRAACGTASARSGWRAARRNERAAARTCAARACAAASASAARGSGAAAARGTSNGRCSKAGDLGDADRCIDVNVSTTRALRSLGGRRAVASHLPLHVVRRADDDGTVVVTNGRDAVVKPHIGLDQRLDEFDELVGLLFGSSALWWLAGRTERHAAASATTAAASAAATTTAESATATTSATTATTTAASLH